MKKAQYLEKVEHVERGRIIAEMSLESKTICIE